MKFADLFRWFSRNTPNSSDAPQFALFAAGLDGRRTPTFNRAISEAATKDKPSREQRRNPFRALKRKPQAKASRNAGLQALTSSPTLYSNYLRYGEGMGAANFEDFIRMARDFSDIASRPGNFGYTFLKLERGVIGVDYQGEIRGIYKRRDGTPLAFFNPNYMEMGFHSRQEELEVWKATGKLIPAVRSYAREAA